MGRKRQGFWIQERNTKIPTQSRQIPHATLVQQYIDSSFCACRSPLPDPVRSVLEEGINLYDLHRNRHGRYNYVIINISNALIFVVCFIWVIVSKYEISFVDTNKNVKYQSFWLPLCLMYMQENCIFTWFAFHTSIIVLCVMSTTVSCCLFRCHVHKCVMPILINHVQNGVYKGYLYKRMG